MKITFISNFVTHHTRALCEALYDRLGTDFAFIETRDRAETGGADAYRMGYAYYWASEERTPVWVVRGWQERVRAERLLMESDAVVTANVDDEWVLPRLRAGKLTFRAHERWYRDGLPWYKRLRAVLGGWLHHGRFPGLRLLCSSAYTAADAARAGCFQGKAYRWGYFPEFRQYSREKLMAMKSGTPVILWAGRMIGLKHPEEAVKACLALKNEGYRFRLKLAGSGPEEEKLREMCAGLDAEFLGDLTPEQLRGEMEKSHIFLFTSDRREGWGTVLNEAMNSGCAVTASHAAGAAPYLVRDGENGFLYSRGDPGMLTDKVRRLLEDPVGREQMGWNAYQAIRDLWTPEIAAGRLLDLCAALEHGEKTGWQDGPGSIAPVLEDDWYDRQRVH